MTDNLPDPLFAPELLADVRIVSSLLRQLSWSHFLSLIYLKDPRQTRLRPEMCRIEHWGPRTLLKRIQSMLFERTAVQARPRLAQREMRNA